MKQQPLKILFIAYFFPPAIAPVLPAIKRVSRIIHYLENTEAFVLTVKPECYPSHISLDPSSSAPISDLHIERTGVIDILGWLLTLRRFAKGFFGVAAEFTPPRTGRHQEYFQTQKKRPGRLKDFISTLMTYPDLAAPWLIPAVYAGVKMVRRYHINRIFATGLPWTSLIVGMAIKILTGVKLVVDFRDPWIANPYVDKGTLERFLDRLFEGMIVGLADLVIANTDALASEMKERYKGKAEKIIGITNGYDVKDFEQIPEIRFPSHEFVIAHAGFLYPQRDPVDILKGIDILKRKRADLPLTVKFLQIGQRQLAYDLNAYCRDMDLSGNISLIDHLDHKTCLGHLKASDMLVLIQPGTEMQIPSKLFEYIYLEKPIVAITHPNGALARLILEHGIGRVFQSGDIHPLSECIQEMVLKKIEEGGIKTDFGDKSQFDVGEMIAKLQVRLRNL